MENTEKTQLPLLAFQNDPEIKAKYVARVERHQKLDNFIQGIYWNGEHHKGCAVGCTLEERYHQLGHKAYEVDLGIPMILARLQDRIFEGLSVEDSKSFPVDFLTAIPTGKDLSLVWKKFAVWLLVDPIEGVIKYAKKEVTKKSIQDVADLIQKSTTEYVSAEQFRQVRRAAYAAADAYAADADAAYAAADAAYAAAAAYAYADDADADAAAADAAYAAAADAAADADAAAYAAYADAYAARRKKYKTMADKLISLLAE